MVCVFLEDSKDDEAKAEEEADGSTDDDGDDDDDDDDVSTGAFTEIRFVPNDKGSRKCLSHTVSK